MKIPSLGRREQQLPSERGPSEVEIGSIRQSGSRKPSCAGRKGQQRKREREGWKFRVKVWIPLLGGFLGNWVPHFPLSPIVSVTVSPGRGSSGRGSHPETRCRGRAVGEGPGGIQKVLSPMQSDERTSEGRSQLRLHGEASEIGHLSRRAPVGTVDLRVQPMRTPPKLGTGPRPPSHPELSRAPCEHLRTPPTSENMYKFFSVPRRPTLGRREMGNRAEILEHELQQPRSTCCPHPTPTPVKGSISPPGQPLRKLRPGEAPTAGPGQDTGSTATSWAPSCCRLPASSSPRALCGHLLPCHLGTFDKWPLPL